MFHGCVVILFVPSGLVKWLLKRVVKAPLK